MDQYLPIDGSLLSLSCQWIKIILLIDHYHYPTNGSTLSYPWIIIIILPMYHHHHHINGATSLSYHYRHPINEDSLSYR